jgi:hypothetical protein
MRSRVEFLDCNFKLRLARRGALVSINVLPHGLQGPANDRAAAPAELASQVVQALNFALRQVKAAPLVA